MLYKSPLIRRRPLEDIDVIVYDIMISVAQLSKCSDKQVACVMINKQLQIISVGVNDVSRCDYNCHDKENRICQVRHAEISAIAHLANEYPWRTYVNLFPCVSCQTALRNLAHTTEIVAFGMVHKEPITAVTVFTHEEMMATLGRTDNYLQRINLHERKS